MDGASCEQEYPAKALEFIVFDINYVKIKGRMVLDILDRSIINHRMTVLRVYNILVIACIYVFALYYYQILIQNKLNVSIKSLFENLYDSAF